MSKAACIQDMHMTPMHSMRVCEGTASGMHLGLVSLPASLNPVSLGQSLHLAEPSFLICTVRLQHLPQSLKDSTKQERCGQCQKSSNTSTPRHSNPCYPSPERRVRTQQKKYVTCPMPSSQVPWVSVLDDSILQVSLTLELTT